MLQKEILCVKKNMYIKNSVRKKKNWRPNVAGSVAEMLPVYKATLEVN